ncbi:MAG TPA: zinc ABC transporter substrate-binding protein [Anaerolineales bacterium]|nr:zinc ABC transporter substrate-binding protein [Anaerolineales bacterium]
MRPLTALVAALTFVLSGCGGQPVSLEAPGNVDVLTTSTILADITRNVAGDRFMVESFLPVGTDPHSYQPTPQDTAKLSQTEFIIVNGAGYEHFLEALLENAGGERMLIEASTGLDLQSDPEHGVDPHLWLDPNNIIAYVKNIREGLTHFDPQGSKIYQSNADAYVAQLQELDAWIETQVTQIPPERRVLVTNHEALGYFAERYGFTIVGTIVESFSSDASPSAQQMAKLIDQIRQSEAPAIFLDASDNPALARQVATETGVRVVTDLHLESLTKGAPAGTYVDLMKYNVTKIVEALK